MNSAGGDTKELHLFREEWRKQLSKEIANRAGNDIEESRFCEPNQASSLSNQHELDKCLPESSGNYSRNDETLFSRLQVLINDSVSNTKKNELILLSFPEPAYGHFARSNEEQNLQSKIGEGVKNVQKSLLDQLIEDIDDITTIPFFDLSLPKEVGIQIFSYLSLKELCVTAQVSKSWKALSEDELIWYRLGCELGYIKKGEHALVDRTNWKEFVRDGVLEDRDLRRNWKERKCRLTTLEFERGGSLCAISVHGNFICSGYSTGAVLLWEVDKEISYRELSTAFQSQGQIPHVTSTAVSGTLCSAGYLSGDVNIWHTNLSSTPLCQCCCDGPVRVVSIASTVGHPAVAAASGFELKVQVSDTNGQWTCLHSKRFEEKLSHVKFIPNSLKSQTESISIATVNSASVLVPDTGCITSLDHVIGGKISCMDCTSDHLALGVGSYGFGTLGNKVRLYSLETTKMLTVLRGHYREITCLDLANCPPHRLVTGSYDCRVRVFDLRSEEVALSFRLGQCTSVTAVQMDEWKVVSGADDGTVQVWDQRMASTLWIAHGRHPLKVCRFSGPRLVTANIPLVKTLPENLWYADDLILHRRHRGLIRLFDFAANNSTLGIPEICSSKYDDTSGYNYNIKLSVPYDRLEGV